LVLGNQFEALVGVNENGVSIPLGAKRWEISDDFKEFRFFIDSSRTFPDGSRLTAGDFKRSWETAAKLNPISANNSLLDVLYKIEGFQEFKNTGSIPGLTVVNDDILEIRFSSPFRMALEHLQGNRFAAFREINGKFFGTGVFELEEISQDHVLMHPRTDLKLGEIPTMDVRFIPPKSIVDSLLSGEIDAIHYQSGHTEDAIRLRDDSIGVIVGQNSLHITLGLNTKRTSFFASPGRRRALQYLISKAVQQNRSVLPAAPFFDADLQFFMPIQAGRLDNNEMAGFVSEGRDSVNELLEASKKHPIVVKVTLATRKIIDLLKALGLQLSDKSSALPPKEIIALRYSKNGPDMLVENFSVASGDPDGIYHILGKNGAIRIPYVYSEAVGDLLEEGRKLVDVSSLDEHYKKVSRALLTEVPMVHLGFARALTAYRKDRVEIETQILRRNQGHLHFMRAKR